jgi:hypothetical protein
MSADHDDARGLLALLREGQPQPALTGRIAACPCGEGVRAGLYLLNGDWERAHEVAQSMEGPTGAHWHALVHRHEPDYANSKYWLRRAGDSPVFPRLLEAAQAAGQAALVAPQGRWDPLRFTDCCADPAQAEWTRPLDALEQRALLALCLERDG